MRVLMEGAGLAVAEGDGALHEVDVVTSGGIVWVGVMKPVHAQQVHWGMRIEKRVGARPLLVGTIGASCEKLSCATSHSNELSTVGASDSKLGPLESCGEKDGVSKAMVLVVATVDDTEVLQGGGDGGLVGVVDVLYHIRC
jgi:hypothetical protein